MALLTRSSRTIVRGTPGKHSAHLARQSLLRTAGLLTVAAVLGLAAFADLIQLQLGKAEVGVVLAAVAALSWHAGQRTWSRTRQQQEGAAAERRVVNALKAAGVVAVVSGVDSGRGDLDQGVFGPDMGGRCAVAAIETKRGGSPRGGKSSEVTYRLGQIVRGSGKPIMGDPLAQARRNAEALARLTGQRVTPILCVDLASSDPFTAEGVIVCGARDLGRVLMTLQPTFDTAAARKTARRLPILA